MPIPQGRNSHIGVCAGAVGRVDTRVDETIVPVEEIGYIPFKDLVNMVRQLDILYANSSRCGIRQWTSVMSGSRLTRKAGFGALADDPAASWSKACRTTPVVSGRDTVSDGDGHI